MLSKHLVLKNGLRVMIQSMPDSKLVDIRLNIKAGAFYDSYYNFEPGTAHFLEHVIHEQTQKFSSKLLLVSAITKNGGQRNATTYADERMNFHATVLYQFAESAFDYISQILFYSKITKESVEKHRKIIKQELQGIYKQPNTKLFLTLKELVFTNSNLKFHAIGTEESISKINLEILNKYKENIFKLENCILTIFGNISIGDAEILSEKYFSNELKNNKISDNSLELKGGILKPEIDKKIYNHTKTSEPQAAFSIAALTEGIEDKFYFEYILLSQILTGGPSSILINRIRDEKHLAYHIDLKTLNFPDLGLFYINANVAEENIQEVINIIKFEIRKIALGEVRESDIHDAKIRLEASVIFKNQQIQNAAQEEAEVMLFDKAKSVDSFYSKIKTITKDNLVKAAENIINNMNILSVLSKNYENYDF